MLRLHLGANEISSPIQCEQIRRYLILRGLLVVNLHQG